MTINKEFLAKLFINHYFYCRSCIFRYGLFCEIFCTVTIFLPSDFYRAMLVQSAVITDNIRAYLLTVSAYI